jgi:hypothetical protein
MSATSNDPVPGRGLATVLALATLLLGVACGGAVWMWQRAEGARQRAETAEAEAKQARDELEHKLLGERQARENLEMALAGERMAKGELEVAQQRLAKAHDDLGRIAYAERINQAQREWEGARKEEAWYRWWERGYFWRLFQPNERQP